MASPRVPGAAGQALPANEYKGSRRKHERFEYSSTSLQGFVELVPGAFDSHLGGKIAGEQFKAALRKVAGVAEVSGKGFPLKLGARGRGVGEMRWGEMRCRRGWEW